jgi:hypothetical protein
MGWTHDRLAEVQFAMLTLGGNDPSVFRWLRRIEDYLIRRMTRDDACS